MSIISQITAGSSSSSVTVPANLPSKGAKSEAINAAALSAIRHHMPIELLFRPELKINLASFVRDQLFFHEMAKFILQIKEPKEFETFPRLGEIKKMCQPDPDTYLAFLFSAIGDVMSEQKYDHHLNQAIKGRIFTLKNALIAQKKPELIHKNQIDSQMTPHTLSAIKEEGASFMRESLAIHLSCLKKAETVPFKEHITSTTAQLVPFVQKITRAYLIENKRDCPENPLTFRNPTGYNIHGVVAAIVMEACLNALGFKTRVMERTDLEPKVTLAMCHNVIEVTGLDNVKYVVDPGYIQFHKDIYANETRSLPSVLVLEEKDVDDYVEKMLMVEWRAQDKLVRSGDSFAIEKLKARDILISHKVDPQGQHSKLVYAPIEKWVKNSLKRVWDLKTYNPISGTRVFQEIFVDHAPMTKTHESIKSMEIASLTDHSSYREITTQLNGLLLEPQSEKNSTKSVTLIAQLPFEAREEYNKKFLFLNPRLWLISTSLNAYFCALKKEVNPKGEDKVVIDACSGADCISVMLATDANEYIFVDLTPFTYHDFKKAFDLYKTDQLIQAFNKVAETPYFLGRKILGGGMSHYNKGNYYMENLPIKVLFDMHDLGVDIGNTSLKEIENGIQIDFKWSYPGSGSVKRARRITLITADITKPDDYPSFLKEKINGGFDIFYMKASYFVPMDYNKFLPHLAKSLRVGGWLMTADKTYIMNEVNPEEMLKDSGLRFTNKKSEEVKSLESLVYLPVDVFSKYPPLEENPPDMRSRRVPGSDFSYWAILNLRQKEASK